MKVAWALVAVWFVVMIVRRWQAVSVAYEERISLKNPMCKP